MANTPIFNIPLLDSSTFSIYDSNNHYRIIEALLNPTVLSIENNPPTNPIVGSWYQVGTNPTSDFINNTGKLATRINDFWFFVDPTISKIHFISPLNTYYNPLLFICDHSFTSLATTNNNQTISFNSYSKTTQVNTLNSQVTISFASLPLFKGQLTIINSGSFSLNILFNSTFILPSSSSRSFFSDGSNVF